MHAAHGEEITMLVMTGLPVRPERLIARAGVTMLRHLDEVFTR